MPAVMRCVLLQLLLIQMTFRTDAEIVRHAKEEVENICDTIGRILSDRAYFGPQSGQRR